MKSVVIEDVRQVVLCIVLKVTYSLGAPLADWIEH